MRNFANILDSLADKPWLAWLIICLCRQKKRQAWHLTVHKKIEVPGQIQGTVPDMPEWSYSYHGMGLCLHGPNSEYIDVDFHDNEAQTIDPYFFANRVLSLEKPELPEARLKYWLPKSQLIASAIKELQKSLLEPEESHTFRLKSMYEADWRIINEINFDDGDISAEWHLKIEQVKKGLIYTVFIDQISKVLFQVRNC